MDHTEAMAAVAQLVINIDSGYTTVEKGSRVYRALNFLIEQENARLDRIEGKSAITK